MAPRPQVEGDCVVTASRVQTMSGSMAATWGRRVSLGDETGLVVWGVAYLIVGANLVKSLGVKRAGIGVELVTDAVDLLDAGHIAPGKPAAGENVPPDPFQVG